MPDEVDLRKVNFLRPNQIEELEADVQQVERALSPEMAPFTKGLDRGAMKKQLRNNLHMLQTQSPREVSGATKDELVKREVELREQMLSDDMPSHEEMRRNPPGAVGKHMGWEKRNKEKLRVWKNIRLLLNAGSTDPDIANFERYRPTQNTLSMDNAQIPAERHYHFPPKIEAKNVMSDDDRDRLIAENEALKKQIAAEEAKKEVRRQNLAKARAMKGKKKEV